MQFVASLVTEACLTCSQTLIMLKTARAVSESAGICALLLVCSFLRSEDTSSAVPPVLSRRLRTDRRLY